MFNFEDVICTFKKVINYNVYYCNTCNIILWVKYCDNIALLDQNYSLRQ